MKRRVKKAPRHHSALEHDRALAELVRLLSRGFYTISEIARNTHCSKVTAHRRIRALVEQRKLRTSRVRQGAAGPLSVAYSTARKSRGSVRK